MNFFSPKRMPTETEFISHFFWGWIQSFWNYSLLIKGKNVNYAIFKNEFRLTPSCISSWRSSNEQSFSFFSSAFKMRISFAELNCNFEAVEIVWRLRLEQKAALKCKSPVTLHPISDNQKEAQRALEGWTCAKRLLSNEAKDFCRVENCHFDWWIILKRIEVRMWLLWNQRNCCIPKSLLSPHQVRFKHFLH